tara:strand:- start:3646 stop:4122 length:477 start_codon:yes stop_codon:yes gene_type:complete
MMTEEVVNILTEAGPLGIFALYLIWQRQKDTLRMEALQEKFLTRLDAMDERSDAAVATLRERYDKVIAEYNKERADMITGFGKLDQLFDTCRMRQQTTQSVPAPAPPTIPPPPALQPEPPGGGMTIQIERKVQEALEKMSNESDTERVPDLFDKNILD